MREDRRDAVAALLRLGANPRRETLDGVSATATAEERGLSEALNLMQNYVASDVAEKVLQEMEAKAAAGRRCAAPRLRLALSCTARVRRRRGRREGQRDPTDAAVRRELEEKGRELEKETEEKVAETRAAGAAKVASLQEETAALRKRLGLA